MSLFIKALAFFIFMWAALGVVGCLTTTMFYIALFLKGEASLHAVTLSFIGSAVGSFIFLWLVCYTYEKTRRVHD